MDQRPDGFTQYGTPPNHNGGLDWDVPVPADYDGDLHADIAVFHPTDHSFHILLSKTGTERIVAVPERCRGHAGAGRLHGDNITDPAVSDIAGTTWWLTPDTPTPTYTFPVVPPPRPATPIRSPLTTTATRRPTRRTTPLGLPSGTVHARIGGVADTV